MYNKENEQESKDTGDKKTEQTDNNSLKKTENVPSAVKKDAKISQTDEDGEKQDKQVNATDTNITPEKEDSNNTVAIKTETVKKADATEIPVTTKEPATTAKQSDAAEKPNAAKIIEPVTSKPPTTSTADKSKAATTAKTSNEKRIASKPVIKPNTVVKKKELPAQNKEKKPPNDYDELNDEDILTLISDGIIIDECSGSDNE